MNSDSCPRKDDLVAYALGKLGDDLIDTVSDHLESCPACRATVGAVDDTQDSIFRVLRKSSSRPDFHDEPECRAAIAAAQAAMNDEHAVAPSDHADTSPLGRIRDYALLRKIGEGGMGTVYAAMHTRLQRMVAIKTLAPGRGSNEQAISRFLREMRAVGKLEHPNIVRAIDAGDADGTFFLVVEYIDGLDLARLIRAAGPLPIADACEIVRQAADALHVVHTHGLVHRDVKPSNLMLTADGTVKLLDLGLAVWHADQLDDADLTATGHVLGTLEYVAPDQAMDPRDVDIRADIYGLGCTFYALLAGHPPFRHSAYRNPLQILMAHAMAPVPSIQEQRKDVPAAVCRAIDRMVAKQRDERFATPAEVAAAVGDCASGSDLTALVAAAMARSPVLASGDVPSHNPHVNRHLSPKIRADEASAEPRSGEPSRPIKRRRPLAAVIGIFALIVAFILWHYPWSPSSGIPTVSADAREGIEDFAGGHDGIVVPTHSPALPPVEVMPTPLPFDQLERNRENPREIGLAAIGRVAFSDELKDGERGRSYWIRTATPDPVRIAVIPQSAGFRPVLEAHWQGQDGRPHSDADFTSGRGGHPAITVHRRSTTDDRVIRINVTTPQAKGLVTGASATYGTFLLCAWQPRSADDDDADVIGCETSLLSLDQRGFVQIPAKPTERSPYIDHPGDIDVFRVRGSATGRMRVTVSPHASLALLVRIHAPDGSTITWHCPTNTSGFVTTTADASPGLISVSAYDGVSTGSYALRIDSLPHPAK